MKGSEQRDVAKSNLMEPFRQSLKDFVSGGLNTLTEVGRHLELKPGFEEALTTARLNKPGGIKQMSNLLGEFIISGGGGKTRFPSEHLRRGQG